tara:strand:- start:11868 stop:17573 length:5706 start_codon:yes stop_codon:yes gene_type:complete
MSREVRLSDRVKQLSFDPSTNAFSLDSVATGFSPFRDFYEDGDVVFYAATDGTRYEVGSGEYRSNSLTRYPLRSNNISSGPYFVDDASAHGATRGKEGHFYPLYLTKSAASGIKGFAGVASAVHEHRFSGFPGVTFYMPNTHAGHAVPAYHPGVSGQNYAVSGGPVDFQGVTEVFVTYPGKTSVFTGAGVSGFSEPRKAGIAFWGNEQTLDYDADIIWSTGENAIGISQPSPKFPIDIGGLTSYSQIRSSGFIGGGSGVQFSGGQALPQSALKTASGGRQLEPFFRNEVDAQTHTDQVFSLSGLVDQRLLFKKQLKGQILAGPASGCDESSATCPQDHPMFRYLELEDIPDLSSLYVVQQNYVDYDTDIPAGAVAFTNASGKIEFDKFLKYNKDSDRLGVGIPIAPSYTLDVGGNAGISGLLMVSGDAHFGGDIHAVGNLLVSGTKTFLDSTTVTVKDINLELGSLSGNPITASVTNDAAIDDAGLIIKSKNYDKKWTWRNATDAWTTTERVDVSGVIFLGDDSVISGAYKPGSGIVIHNVGNGHRIDIGNIFHVSGTDQNTGFLHQNSVLVVSGVSGINTTYTPLQEANQVPSGRLTINPSFLYNAVFDKIDASGNKISGVLTGADTYLTQRIDASGNRVSGAVQNTVDLLHASGNAISGWANTHSNQVSGYLNTQDSAVSGYNNYFAILSGVRAQDVASGVAMDASGALNLKIDDALGGESFTLYSNWKVSASGGANYNTHITDPITAGQGVHFEGFSGVVADYTASNNAFRFAAPGLSGMLNLALIASGNKVSGAVENTMLAVISSGNTLSGIISGADTYLTQRIDASGNKVSGVLTALDTYLTQRIDASGNRVSGAVEDTRAFALSSALASGNSAIIESSGWTSSVSGYVDAKVGSLGGGYGQWKISASGGANNNTHVQDNVASNNSVHFMGVSGLVADYTASDNIMRLAAPGLSGDIMQHITNSGNSAILETSGYFQHRIGGLAGGYGHWKVSASGGANNSTHISDQILSQNALHIQGISGVVADYTAATNILRINAPGLSGFVTGKHTSLSGWVNTHVANTAGAGYSAGSGLVLQGNQFNVIGTVSGGSSALSGYVNSTFRTKAEAADDGYGYWLLSASGGASGTTHVTDYVTSGTTIDFMGVSGVVANYTTSASGNIMRFAAPGLSGWVNTHVANQVHDAYGHWLLSASGGVSGLQHVTDHVVSGTTIDFMGVSGVVADYTTGVSGNIMRFAAPGISGWANTSIVQQSGWVNTHVAASLATVTDSGVFAGSGMIKTTNSSGIFLHQDSGNLVQLITASGNSAIAVASGAIPNAQAPLVVGTGKIKIDEEGSGYLGSLMLGGDGSAAHWRAGHGSLAFKNAIVIGDNAAIDIWGSGAPGDGGHNRFDLNSVIVGRQAASGFIGSGPSQHTSNNPIPVTIGAYSLAEASGIGGVAIGLSAARNLAEMSPEFSAGSRVIAIGDSVLRSAFNPKWSTIIGSSAGYNASGIDATNAIGYRAFYKSKYISNSIAIGTMAGASGNVLTHCQFIGHDAGADSSGIRNGAGIGWRALSHSSGNVEVNAIGYQAASVSRDLRLSDYFGFGAGHMSSGAFLSQMFGPYAAQDSYGLSYDIGIGWSTFKYHKNYEGNVDGGKNIAIGYASLAGSNNTTHLVRNTTRNIVIGSHAGHDASGLQNSVAIGRNALNYNSVVATEVVENTIAIGRGVGKGGTDRRLGSYNLIIEPTTHSNSRHTVWSDDYDPYIISIGSVIHGYSNAAVHDNNSSSRHLMVGREPANTSELLGATLTVKPDTSTSKALVLKRHQAQAAAMIEVEVNNVPLSPYSGRTSFTLVGENGYPRIPVARYRSGSDVYDETGNKIPKEEGMFAIWNPAAGQTPTLRYYIVYVGSKWRRQVAHVLDF